MMAQEFRYPLTRICLRSGTLTLPMAMLQVFPDDGDVAVQDTLRGDELVVRVEGRQVSGLEAYLSDHDLEVNDEIVVKHLDDGGLGFTAVKRVRKPDYHRPEVLGRLLDEILDAGVPMTEAEIRALHPDLPSGFPLREALEAESRLGLHQGRWQSSLALEEERRAAERLAEERRRADAERRAEAARRAEVAAKAAEQREVERRAEAAARAAAQQAAEQAAEQTADAERQERQAAVQRVEAERRAEAEAAERAEAERVSREELAARAEEDARAHARRERDARADARAAEQERPDDDGEGPERFDWNEPVGRGFRLPWQRPKAKPAKAAKPAPSPTPSESPAGKDPFRLDRLGEARPSSARPSVVPAPRAGLFPGDTALNSASLPAGDPAKTKRARETFAGFGYRVEGLAHGQLMLHADLGRRNHRVLLHVLPDGERLDWAALLARRRESGATYLAVLGDHRDLHRLTAPADLARATLWSWAGVERVRELSNTMMLGPADLEPHFDRDGVFEYGLERFERSIAKRVQEKGVVSAVLTRLAGLRAPAVFVIEDLVGDADVSRDQIVRVLERLAEAPFHLISKVDSGEFCLRYRVHDALDQLAEYATSLRARLPDRHRERVRGLSDDDLMDTLDPIGADDVDLPSSAAPRSRSTSAAPASTPDTTGRAAPARVTPVDDDDAPQQDRQTSEQSERAAVPVPAQRERPRSQAAGTVEPATRTRPADAAAQPGQQRRGQDALFGDGFQEGFGGTDFGEDAADEVDVSDVIKPRQRGGRRRG